MTEKKQFRVVCMVTEPTLNDAIVTAVRVGNNIEGVDVSLTQRINDPTVGTIVDSRNVYEFIRGQNDIDAKEKPAALQGGGYTAIFTDDDWSRRRKDDND